VNWTRDQPDAELVIRLHPSLQNKPESDLRYWDPLDGRNVVVVRPESEVDSYALAESADLVITYGSTMGVEAAFLGKPVLSLCDTEYCGLDIVYEPQTSEEVLALLGQSFLPPKPRNNCLPYGYYFLTFGIPFRFYQPESLFEGSFMGTKLSMEPDYMHRSLMANFGRGLIRTKTKLRGLRRILENPLPPGHL
jgi:fructose-specific component phosphotransferase system IIB-like protein